MNPAHSRRVSAPDLLACCFYLHLLPLSVCACVQDFELELFLSPEHYWKVLVRLPALLFLVQTCLFV